MTDLLLWTVTYSERKAEIGTPFDSVVIVADDVESAIALFDGSRKTLKPHVPPSAVIMSVAFAGSAKAPPAKAP